MDRRWHVGAMAAGVFVFATSVESDEAEIVDVEAMPEAEGTWHSSVTVRHADKGWDHYADK